MLEFILFFLQNAFEYVLKRAETRLKAIENHSDPPLTGLSQEGVRWRSADSGAETSRDPTSALGASGFCLETGKTPVKRPILKPKKAKTVDSKLKTSSKRPRRPRGGLAQQHRDTGAPVGARALCERAAACRGPWPGRGALGAAGGHRPSGAAPRRRGLGAAAGGAAQGRGAAHGLRGAGHGHAEGAVTSNL